jgi:hypothetical protein
MLAEILIENKPYRFRISWLSKPHQVKGEFLFDIELTDISEDPSTLYEGKRIDYYKWKQAIKENKVKIIM